MRTKLSHPGFIFWPVGTGDSTTVVISPDNTILQIDLHHLSRSEDGEDEHVPIVDELVRLLPKRGGRPYLAAFALTHPDQDHILGFADLLKRVDIGQIWHTPRIFRENNADLCDDAIAFKNEVQRRCRVTVSNPDHTPLCHQVLVIGHDDIFAEGKYRNFPARWRACPGNLVTKINGIECAQTFQAFIHAPFKEESTCDRNDTSLALHITISNGYGQGRLLLFGDLSYSTLRRIVDKTKEKGRWERLSTDVLLTPHHCSKNAMYVKGEGSQGESLKQDILDDFDWMIGDRRGYIISSSESDFSDEKGKNPPHLKARRRYEEIVSSQNHFICTHEHGGPVSFIINGRECVLQEMERAHSRNSINLGKPTVIEAVRTARGSDAPPNQEAGFGAS